MIKRKAIILCCFLLVWGAKSGFCQSGTVASGGDATGTNGKVSYSIGQVDYQTASSSGGMVTEGLQQPYEITVITGIDQSDIDLAASVYPNPTAGLVTLNTGDTDVQNMSYSIFGIDGKSIAHHSLSKKQTEISMYGLSAGTYFIKVMSDKTELKIFKIVKNN